MMDPESQLKANIVLRHRKLVAVAQGGSDKALQELISDFRGLIHSKARRYFLAGADSEDLVQEAMIGFYKAVRDYRNDAAASFRSFAALCIDRQLFTAIKSATRMKHSPLNSYVPFHPLDGSDDEMPQPARRNPSGLLGDPVDYLVALERCSFLRNCLRERLSELEARVLQLTAEGISYEDIAGMVQRDSKAVDNAVQRARRKLAAALIGEQ